MTCEASWIVSAHAGTFVSESNVPNGVDDPEDDTRGDDGVVEGGTGVVTD